MKKVFLTLFLLLGILIQIYSQERVKLEFGPKLSAGTSTYYYTGKVNNITNSFSPKFSFQVGGYARFKFRRAFMQSEFFWLRKGMKGLYIIGQSQEKVTLNSDYMASALLFGLELDRFSMAIGPELGFNLRNTIDGQREKGLFETKIDASFNYALDYRFTKYLRIGTRYNYGLAKIWKVNFIDPLANLITEADVKQHAFFVTVSYNFLR